MDNFQELYSKMSDEEEFYFKNRLDNQINWYDDRSMINQKKFKCYKTIVIASSSLITFLIAFSEINLIVKISAGLLSVMITTFEGILNINKYQENWIEYRAISETLQHEKYMYLYNSGVYREKEGRFEFFVERIESIVSKENINWANLNKNERGNKQNG